MPQKIFISYSHEDAAVAAQIRAALESVGLTSWIDSSEIKPGQSFLERISEGLSNASYVLALISKYSTSSHWTNREWLIALAKRDIVVMPLLLDDSAVPILLRDILYIDLREDPKNRIQEVVKFFLLENSGGIQQQQQQQQQQQNYPPSASESSSWSRGSSWSSNRGASQQQQQQQHSPLEMLQKAHPLRTAN